PKRVDASSSIAPAPPRPCSPAKSCSLSSKGRSSAADSRGRSTPSVSPAAALARPSSLSALKRATAASPPVQDASSGSRKAVMGRNVALRLLAIGLALLLASIGLLSFSHAQTDQAAPPAGQVTPDPWPKVFTISGAKYTLYQPQVDKWDGYNFEGHAAVAVLPAGSKDPVFGAVEITAVTDVAKVSRTVHFRDVKIARAVFSSAPSQAAAYQQASQSILARVPSTIPLNPLTPPPSHPTHARH